MWTPDPAIIVTAEQKAAAAADAVWSALRAERDRRLVESDWTQLPDTPVDRAAWATYRQALRDLATVTIDPTNPEWPAPPG